MKKICTIIQLIMLISLMIPLHLHAQTPEKMSYQAVVRDASNNLVTNTEVGMQISILKGLSTGAPVYTETQLPTTNENGLVSIEIGTGVTSDDFSTIDWSNDTYFIKTETDLAGGTSYTITGISQLLSVPYALHSKTAEIITGTIEETDPIYCASVASKINETDTTLWNNKSEFSGNYDDLINKPQFRVSILGDTLYLENDTWVIIQGISDTNRDPNILLDYDNNIYQTVIIGDQQWMAENLKSSHYANGDTITGHYAYDDNISNIELYGRLYTWDAIMNNSSSSALNPSEVQGACPDGWHIPSDDEWKELEIYLGMSSIDADKEGWRGTIADELLPNGSTGFNAYSSGMRYSHGVYAGYDSHSYYWTTTLSDSDYYWTRNFSEGNEAVGRYHEYKESAISVRCVKD